MLNIIELSEKISLTANQTRSFHKNI